MKYIAVTDNEKNFRGFWSKKEHDHSNYLLAEEGDVYVEFEGPDYDGNDETFEEVKRLAQAAVANSAATK